MILVERTGLVPGLLLERYKRFLADVRLADGSVVTAHTTNTGSMKTCWEPGDRVLLERAANPDRKLKFTWLAVERGGGWVGVETGMPNKVVAEAARRDCPACGRSAPRSSTAPSAAASTCWLWTARAARSSSR